MEGELAIVGITAFAVDQLGDIAFVDLPPAGKAVERKARFGEIESTKAVADLFAPVSGVITEVNAGLAKAPEAIKNDPYGAGWMIKIRCADLAEIQTLLAADVYLQHCASIEH